MLKELQTMIEDVNSSNSNNDKINKLKKYPNLKKILLYVNNPLMQFNITSKSIKKYEGPINEEYSDVDIYKLLEDLSDRKITGHEAIASVCAFIISNREYEDLIYKIIDKNLETRMSASSINKVFKDLIPQFKVQLADKITDKIKLDFENDTWFSSHKIDGLRMIAICNDEGKVKLYSRTGKEFLTLDVIKKEIESWNMKGFVLDGEVCLIDENGKEDFTGIQSEYNKKNHTIENPKYLCFDILTLKEFNDSKGVVPFSIRYQSLVDIVVGKSEYIEVLPQIKIENEEHFETLITEASDKNWEGLILRKDVNYAAKRSKNMLKIKKFNDDEYIVKDILSDEIRYIKDGKDINEEMLSKIIIEHKGNEVGVGSGFSIQQRIDFFNDPSLIVGKTVCIKYFEETTDKKGNHSLRFPTLKHIYENKRDN